MRISNYASDTITGTEWLIGTDDPGGTPTTKNFKLTDLKSYFAVAASTNTTLADNVELICGDGNDLRIYHDTSHSVIASSTGNLNITTQSGGTIQLGHSTSEVTVLDNLTANGNLTTSGDTITFSSTESNDPLVTIKNTTNDATGARLHFVKDKGAAGADGDDIGTIEFIGDDAAQTQTSFAKIVAEVSETDDTDEAGKLSFYVAESDGTTTTLTAGLVLEGEHATDGEVDVTIGAGTSSTTAVAGNLTVAGTVNATGNVTGTGFIKATTFFAGTSEDLASGAAASLTKTLSYFTTGGSETATLAAGTEGQIKMFSLVTTDGGDMVITVTNAGWKASGTGTITFDTLGEGCTLMYANSKWCIVGNHGCVFA
tara:strand:+ start:1244 stop:2356 length:1113 start_codon:yes stop_codon:yes gene_type:complete